ncbi:MAG: hypothetical protein RBG13Loki_1058 [Promethearchaeota archaeon CR_4]|nr:MAG: hypothetical protein RBG13Loki_1058 [Candidatus Lokiarchaeota archaeon CR_4]
MGHAKEALAGTRKKLYTKRRQLKGKQARLVKAEQARDHYNTVHDIKRNAKNAPWTPERNVLKANLNQLRAEVRSKAATIATLEEQIPTLQKALKKVEKSYQKKKQASLQAGRLAARFKALLQSRPADFATGKAQLDTILARSKNVLAPKLRKFLKTHPELFATKVPDLDALCPPAAATTNIIEGIFGLLRPLLRKARHFGATPAAAALFEIVRLRHNLTPPYTGPNNGTTPLERVGVHSRYADYLDALFPPNGIKSECGRSVKVFEQKIIQRIPGSHTGISTGIAPAG